MSKKALALLLAVAALGLVSAACDLGVKSGIARGRELYDTCVPCHGKTGIGNADLKAPVIAGLPEWYVAAQLDKYRHSIRGAHPSDMEGHRMRPMAKTLKDSVEVAAVARYVASLPAYYSAATLHGGNAQAGQARYNTVCTVCHGPDAKGLESMRSPSLAQQADWYLYSQLDKFKNGMRGAHPNDITGGQMRAMSATLENDQAMKDVVAYIKTLRR